MLFYEKIIKDDTPTTPTAEPAAPQPKPVPPKAPNKKRQQRNKKKKGGVANTANPPPNTQLSSAAEEKKTPKTEIEEIRWETPQYTVHYREADTVSDDSFLKDFIISVDLSPLVCHTN